MILACGGRSYPSLGGCAEGARLAEKLGVKQEPQRPALCAVMTEENTEAVKGVRVACSAWFEEGNTEWKQSGELQITEYGLSGIMIFNLSSELGRILSENQVLSCMWIFTGDRRECICAGKQRCEPESVWISECVFAR